MKVRYMGDYYKVVLQRGAVYDVAEAVDGMYRIFIDVYGDHFLFLPDNFEVVEDDGEPSS